MQSPEKEHHEVVEKFIGNPLLFLETIRNCKASDADQDQELYNDMLQILIDNNDLSLRVIEAYINKYKPADAVVDENDQIIFNQIAQVFFNSPEIFKSIVNDPNAVSSVIKIMLPYYKNSIAKILVGDTDYFKKVVSWNLLDIVNEFPEDKHNIAQIFANNPQYFRMICFQSRGFYDIAEVLAGFPDNKDREVIGKILIDVKAPDFFLTVVNDKNFLYIVKVFSEPEYKDAICNIIFSDFLNFKIYFREMDFCRKIMEVFPGKKNKVENLYMMANNPLDALLPFVVNNNNYSLIQEINSVLSSNKEQVNTQKDSDAIKSALETVRKSIESVVKESDLGKSLQALQITLEKLCTPPTLKHRATAVIMSHGIFNKPKKGPQLSPQPSKEDCQNYLAKIGRHAADGGEMLQEKLCEGYRDHWKGYL